MKPSAVSRSFVLTDLAASDGGHVILTVLDGEHDAVSSKGMVFVDGDIARSRSGEMYCFSSSHGFRLVDLRRLKKTEVIVRTKKATRKEMERHA